MKEHNNESKTTNDVSMDDYLSAQAELDALRKEHGIEPKEGRVSHFISSLFERQEAREKVCVSRKKLLWITLLTGWFGGHRFYTKRYVLGAVYLVFFWTGVPLAMTIIDLMVYIPIKPDENGNVWV